jgi:hypothetical protein
MVTSTTNRVQYSPGGATTVFAYDFLVLSASHLVVTVTTRRR